MADEKNKKDGKESKDTKDLTGLLQYSKSLEGEGKAPPVPEGAIMEEAPIEKIEEFESLEQYAQSAEIANPSPEHPKDSTPTETPDTAHLEAEATPDAESISADLAADSENLPESTEDFNALPQTDSPETGSGQDFVTSDFSAPPEFSLGTGIPGQTPDQTSDQSPDSSFAPSLDSLADNGDNPLPDDAAHLQETPSEFQADVAAEPQDEPQPSVPAEASHGGTSSPPRKPAPPTPKKGGISVAPKAPTPPAVPFSIMITGKLSPEEKEKLLDVVSRTNIGIRELDLEPQIDAGRVLIPRISEYAAIFIVQAMRSIKALIRVGPSDLIFATPETRDEISAGATALDEKSVYLSSSESLHPADRVPITTGSQLPGQASFATLDIVSASAALASKAVEVENTPDYEDMLEALKLELKYKAYRKGADAIIDLKIQLDSLHTPTHYRLTLTGSAVTFEKHVQPTL